MLRDKHFFMYVCFEMWRLIVLMAKYYLSKALQFQAFSLTLEGMGAIMAVILIHPLGFMG